MPIPEPLQLDLGEKHAFLLTTGADTAGVNGRLAHALRVSASPANHWYARSMFTSTNYIDYPVDVSYNLHQLLQLYDAADVVLLNSTMHGHTLFNREQPKHTVLQHHGVHFDHFDKDVYGCIAEGTELGALQTGTTVNLELLAKPGAPSPKTITWLPTAYDLDELHFVRQAMYEPHPDGRIRVVHAPTDRKIKSTNAVIAAVDSLKAKGLPVELVLIERQTHKQTMTLKAHKGDILVDQLNLGYGCNAVEAWALGMPVIGGVNEHADWRQHMIARFGLLESPLGLPFYEATEATLRDAIETLVTSAQARRDWAEIGEIHVKRHHSLDSVATLASQLFDLALNWDTKPVKQTFRPRTRLERMVLEESNKLKQKA